MKGIKKFLVMILAITMIMSLAACGSKSSNESTEEAASTDPNAAAYEKIIAELDNADVQKDGDLVVATSPDFAPMEFIDTSKTGDAQYVGYDIILAKYIANALGKNLVIKPMSFDAVQSAVQTGSVDMGISGFSWTEERSKNYFITDWYEAGDNETEQVVITTTENDGKFNSASDFSGLKVGAQGGSLQKLLAEEQLEGADVQLFENLNDAVTALLTGKIDALAVAQGNAEAFISANEGKLVQAAFQFTVDDLYKNNVVLLNKNNTELGEQVNKIIAQQKADGVANTWYEACQMLAKIKTIDELGYDDAGNKITE